MALLSRLLASHRTTSPGVEENSPPQPVHPRPPPSRPEAWGLFAPESNDISHSQYYAQVAQGVLSTLSSTCRWLDPGDVEIFGEHPVAAGGFANIWEGTHDGRKVALKSYRCYESFDAADVVARFHNEVNVWTLLHQQDVDIVPLVGVYSTEEHAFGLIYEYMDGLDGWQYLRKEPNAGRLNLLAGIARGLSRLHDLDVVHGNLRTSNILVDKDGTPWIAGLGSAFPLPGSTAWMVGGSDSTAEVNWPGMPMGPTHHSKASDVCAFGVMAWEIFMGRPQFSEVTGITAVHLMTSGSRPSRPDHHEVSDPIWRMMKSCWHTVAYKRMSIGEVVTLLEVELNRTPTSGV